MVTTQNSEKRDWAHEAGKRVGEVVTRTVEGKNPLIGAAFRFAEGLAKKAGQRILAQVDQQTKDGPVWTPGDPKVILYVNRNMAQTQSIDEGSMPLTQIKRSQGYHERLQTFVERLNTELPERVQIELRVAGNLYGLGSAHDDVTIRVFNEQGTMVAIDKFTRKIRAEDRYSGAFYLKFPLEAAAEMLIPEHKRDQMFYAYVIDRAKLMVDEPGKIGKFTDAAEVKSRDIGLGCYFPKAKLTV